MPALNAKARDDLTGSQFAYIDSKGGKHLPIPDADHVRAALTRFTQTQFDNDDDRKAAAGRLAAAAKKYGISVDAKSPVGALAMAEDADAPDDCPTCDGSGSIREGHVKCPDCDGSGDAPDGDDDADMAEPVSLYALSFAERLDAAEGKPIPFAAVGDWTFDEYGKFTITPDDLRTMKANFDADVRRQRLPIINEAHDRDRAVGWIKDLAFNETGDRLMAVPEWNSIGKKLVANGEYGYTSPEMEYRTMVLHNWADPEHPTVKHPTVAAGLALTNFPKIKKLGAIAASETAPGCELIACSERSVAADHPMRAAMLMAEGDPDDDGDDDGPMACINQPPIAAMGACPGYTRRPKDLDGDGCCQFADKGCNGYRPVSGDLAVQQAAVGNSPTAVTFYPTFAETKEHPMPVTETAETQPTTPAQPEASNAAALMAENASLSAKFAESEKSRVELAERVAAMERRETLTGIKARFDELIRSGRVSPAEREALIGGEKGDENAIKLSENDFVLAALEARKPNSAVDMSERAAAGNAGEGDSAHDRLVALAEEIRKAEPTLTAEGAYAKAIERNPALFAETRTSRPRGVA